MTTTINSYASSSALAQNGVDVITFDTTGITAGLSDALALTKTKTSLNATGSAPMFACRAWVNFNGTGTVAIRASGNVSSITDNGVGLYTVNFIAAMPDTNYSAVNGGYRYSSGSSTQEGFHSYLTMSISIDVLTLNGGAFYDSAQVNVAIFR